MSGKDHLSLVESMALEVAGYFGTHREPNTRAGVSASGDTVVAVVAVVGVFVGVFAGFGAPWA